MPERNASNHPGVADAQSPPSAPALTLAQPPLAAPEFREELQSAPLEGSGKPNLLAGKSDDEIKRNPAMYRRDFNTAEYGHYLENPFLAASENPLSIFSIDIDTASYTIARSLLPAGPMSPND